MQFFQELLHWQYRYSLEKICSLSHINTEHLVDLNAARLIQGTHGTLPAPVPLFGQFYLKADDNRF